MIIPIEQRLRTTLPIPLSSRKCRVSEPSNKITATLKETTGNNKSPNNASGSSTPLKGPRIKPVSSKNKIAGTRNAQATHCANTEHKAIPAIKIADIE